MATNQIVELKSLVMTSKNNNEIVERLKSFLEKMSKEKRVNWQMLACYLDGKIFEFIQANRNRKRIIQRNAKIKRPIKSKIFFIKCRKLSILLSILFHKYFFRIVCVYLAL